jgi:transcription elongation factor Elf1
LAPPLRGLKESKINIKQELPTIITVFTIAFCNNKKQVVTSIDTIKNKIGAEFKIVYKN